MSSKSPIDRGVDERRPDVIVLAGGGIGPVISPEEALPLLDHVTIDDLSPDWAESELITTHEVVARLGISRGVLDGWLRTNKAIAFRNENEELFFPVRQFEAGQPIEGLNLICPLFGSVEDAWEWLLAPNRMTEGVAPLERLRCGDVALVVNAAQAALDFA